jgi:DNA (cytosine-5)-methyltransferase 3A
MNVLSLFDGISCGRLALQRANIKVNNYYSSEINKHAITISKKNFPENIHLGSVIDLDTSILPKIDLLIGGSPCQSFSMVGKRNGMTTTCDIEVTTLSQYLELKREGFKFEGQSYLFWEYVRIYKELKPTYFFLENVNMVDKWKNIISKELNVDPLDINSSLFSAQSRRRLYWTNIGHYENPLFGNLESNIIIPKDKGILLKDILELYKDVNEKYYLSEKTLSYLIRNNQDMQAKGNGFKFEVVDNFKKSKTVTTKEGQRMTNNFVLVGDFRYDEGIRWRKDEKAPCITLKHSQKIIKQTDRIRKLTPLECERLQTLPDNYTEGISDNQRYFCIGNGWTVDVIAYIFKEIKQL